jgi:hypothetical protein
MNSQDLYKKINDLLFLRQEDGSYHIFGQYLVTRDHNQLYVIKYLQDPDLPQVKFSQLKYAVTWCVFHKNKKYGDLPKIAELDEKLDSLQAVIQHHKKLLLRNNDKKLIYMAKLSENKLKRKLAQKSMDYYVSYSKYWQDKTFKEYQGR